MVFPTESHVGLSKIDFSSVDMASSNNDLISPQAEYNEFLGASKESDSRTLKKFKMGMI